MRRNQLGWAAAIVIVGVVGGCAHHKKKERVVYRDRVVYEPAPTAVPTTTPSASVETFRADLAPYGRWESTPEYGEVWVPGSVAADWSPCRVGRWSYADDAGWVWMSDEPFGWATYHYGRWARVDRHGWVWVPGDEWAPAWVSWRNGGGYAGWAPLPPERRSFSVGVSFGSGVAIAPSDYAFVHEGYLGAPRVSERIVDVQQNNTIINQTNVTNVTREDGRIVNRGVDPAQVERAGGAPVQRYATAQEAGLRRSAEADRAHQSADRRDGGEARERREMAERHRREAAAATPENRGDVAGRHARVQREMDARHENARRRRAE